LPAQRSSGLTGEQKTFSQAPNYNPARLFLGLCYSMQGRREEALVELQKGRAIAPNSPDFISLLGNVSALADRRDDARRYQEQLNELAKRAYVSPFAQAVISADLGEIDAAFMWMGKSFEERCSALPTLKTDPRFDVLRSDARFELLMRRVGFAP
jgi:tetratricopeptide (TPR) repeat protein